MAEAGDKIWKRQPCWRPEAEEHDGGNYQRDADEGHRGVSSYACMYLLLGMAQTMGNRCGCASTQGNT